MSLEYITIEDCIDMYEKKDMAAVINDGQVIGFIKEKLMKEDLS